MYIVGRFLPLIALLTSAFSDSQPASAPYEKVVIEGNHGCPFSIVASNIAIELKNLGMISELVITRGGQRHVPTYDSESVSLEWLEMYWRQEKAEATSYWDGSSSPRVVYDDNDATALDCSNFLLANMNILRKHNANLGLLKPISPEMWKSISKNGCSAIWEPAYCGVVKIGTLFLVDPPGPVRNNTSGNVLYRDVGLRGGVFSAREKNEWGPSDEWCDENLPQLNKGEKEKRLGIHLHE